MRTHLEYVRPAARDNEFVDAPEAIGLHMLLTEALESWDDLDDEQGWYPAEAVATELRAGVRRRLRQSGARTAVNGSPRRSKSSATRCAGSRRPRNKRAGPSGRASSPSASLPRAASKKRERPRLSMAMEKSPLMARCRSPLVAR